MPDWLQTNRTLFGAGSFAVALPALALLCDLGFALSLGLSGLAGLGVYLLLSRDGPDMEIDSDILDAGQREAARQILSDAMTHVARLRSSRKRIREKRVGNQVHHLADLFERTISDVKREPERLGSVRRLLTFYAKHAGDIAEAYATIEGSVRPDHARLLRAEESLRKIDDAWVHFADKLAEPDRTNLDIDLDMLDQSLKSDMETLSWR